MASSTGHLGRILRNALMPGCSELPVQGTFRPGRAIVRVTVMAGRGLQLTGVIAFASLLLEVFVAPSAPGIFRLLSRSHNLTDMDSETADQ